MKWKLSRLLTLSLLSASVITGCGLVTPDPAEEDLRVKLKVAATLTKEALERAQTYTPAAEPTFRATVRPTASPPTVTPLPATETMEPTLSPTATLTPTIAHLEVPGEPGQKLASYLTDISSIFNAAEGYTYGDTYLVNRYERPFEESTMAYVGYLDIIYTELKHDSPWLYFIIHLQETLPEVGDARYGIEFDLDGDGRGEYFLSASLPEGKGWTTDGVWVYEDLNGDVGGTYPVFPDASADERDGYEKVVFEEGRGPDPDLAWVRRDPDDGRKVQIALKETLINAPGYLWSIWAEGGKSKPTFADYNDYWSLEEAGVPLPGHPLYPIKNLALVDSTCRSWYGFQPDVIRPGMCQRSNAASGWKVCFSYKVSGLTTVNQCDALCLDACPRLPGTSEKMEYQCKRCRTE